MLVFTLTMPGIGSWNGKWTGEGLLHCSIRSLKRKKELELDGKDFLYRWDDGWIAKINVKKVYSVEAKKLKKQSKGFLGYEWMIDSIIEHNKIILY